MIQDVIRNQAALQRLIEVCRSQRSIAVTGAGLSWWAGYRTWNELIDQLAERVRERRGDEVNVQVIRRNYRDRLLCAEKLAAELGPRGEFEEFIRGEFGPVAPRDRSVLQTFARIPFRDVITFNFEESAERSYEGATLPCRSISSANDRELIRYLRQLDQPQTHRHVVHVHGKYSDPQGRIILMEAEYGAWYQPGGFFKNFLWSLFASRTLIFFGCGFEDSDFVGCLREAGRVLRLPEIPHFAVVGLGADDDDGERRTHFNSAYLIEPLFYEIGPENSHQGFVETLRTLADATNPQVPGAQPDAVGNAPEPARHDLEIVERLGMRFMGAADFGGDDVPR
jgi:hypothetical protein